MAFKCFLLLLSISCAVGAATVSINEQPIKPGYNLKAQQLYGESTSGGLGDCWSAQLELKACTNEIVLFFINGESYLGLDCCRAIRIITRNCWPTMLTSLGFTSQEGDILRDYCDASPTSSVSPIQAPVKAPIGIWHGVG